MRRLTRETDLVDALAAAPRTAPLGARSRAIIDYALKLTTTPSDMRDADVHALRDAGLTDAGILDVNAVTAYFNFVNRVAQGLGVDLEPSGGQAAEDLETAG